MKITDRVYLVGSGTVGGFNLSYDYDCNVYLLDCGSELALIDAGAAQPEQICANIQGHGLDPGRVTHIFLTHKHADHAGGAFGLKERTGAAVLGSKHTAEVIAAGDEDRASLTSARAAGVYPADYRLQPCPVDRVLEDGDVVQVGDVALRVVATPGHCDGHLSFWTKLDGAALLFAGDAVLPDGKIVLQNIPDCSVHLHIASIKKLTAIPVDAFFPGHSYFSLRHGRRHIDAALNASEGGGAPRNFLH